MKNNNIWWTLILSVYVLGLLQAFYVQAPVDMAAPINTLHPRTLSVNAHTLAKDQLRTMVLNRMHHQEELARFIDALAQDDQHMDADAANWLDQQQDVHMLAIETRDQYGVWSRHVYGNPPYADGAGAINPMFEKLQQQSEAYSGKIDADGASWELIAARDERSWLKAVICFEHEALQAMTKHEKIHLRIEPDPLDRRPGVMKLMTHHFPFPVAPQNTGTHSHVDAHRIVVSFHTPPTDKLLYLIQRDLDASIRQGFHHTYILSSTSYGAEEMKTYLNNSNFPIAYTEYLYYYESNQQLNQSTTPNDILFEHQWNMVAIQQPLAWKRETGLAPVIVAVLDTGCDLTHVDMQNRWVTGWDTFLGNHNVTDPMGHGTHVAGIIAANTNNQLGIAGMAAVAKIMPIRVLDEEGVGSAYTVAEGIVWAVDHGASVINMSLGNYADSQYIHNAIRYAYERNVVLIAASGNDGSPTPSYPSAYPEVMAVSATEANGRYAPYANHGQHIEISAPGSQIASTFPHNHFASMSGTSMASPHVAAAAAMVRAAKPQLSNNEIMEVLRRTAVDKGQPGHDHHYGFGEINTAAALEAVLGPDAASVQPDPATPAFSWLDFIAKWVFGQTKTANQGLRFLSNRSIMTNQ